MGAANDYVAPRGSSDKPGLNRVWQVLNRANFDVDLYVARAALQLVAGDLKAVPAPELVRGWCGSGGFWRGRWRVNSV